VLHNSYSFALAFEAGLVRDLLTRLCVDERSLVLDPFCGTGTTLLEAKIAGYNSVGVDANPICVIVSRAKTNWKINIQEVRANLIEIVRRASSKYSRYEARAARAKGAGEPYPAHLDSLFVGSPMGRYLVDSGLIRRGWISPRPALKCLLLAEQIRTLPKQARNFLLLSFLGLLVPEFSNMAYGPEIYRKRKRRDRDVFGLFVRRANENLEKLSSLRLGADARSRVRLGDSSDGGLGFLDPGSVDAIITSPPYLSDHDYSRLTRLELVFAGFVSSAEQLRKVKKLLLRSSSKNVYRGDSCARYVTRFRCVREAIARIRERAARRSSGFSRVYPRLIGEYFGGMYQHFRGAGRVLRPGGYAAYIVGDQSSFFATPIPTAGILARLAESCHAGLELVSMEPIRRLRGTRGKVTWTNSEWLMLLRKRSRSGRL
jgi:DNA modification methylase